jgi:hypothetical protein
MMSFRNSMGLIAVVALAVVIGMLVYASHTLNPRAENALAAVESTVVNVERVAVKLPHEHWFPRASTYADEVAHVNHEGF